MQNNLTNIILKYKHYIFIFWLLLIIFSIWNIKFSKAENYETELTGITNTEAYEVIKTLDQEFNFRLGSSCAIVLEKKTEPELLSVPLGKRFPQFNRIIEIKD